MNDPNFEVGFYSKLTQKAATVEFDTINGIPRDQLSEDLMKKASTFSLPLSPHRNTSRYNLSFTEYTSDIADTINYTKDLVVTYRRQVNEMMGAILITADSFQVYSHNFDSLAPAGIDPLLLSNDILIKVYF